MEKILVETASGTYPIYFGPQIWSQVQETAKSYSQALVVSDQNVAKLYGDRLPWPSFVLAGGEGHKNLASIELLVTNLAERGLDRQSVVLALGGGIVGDLAAFAASIYQRGIALIQIPTTLLAQVDSSVGGKTGVNLPQGKNLLGTFYQPKAVFIDPGVLKTLPEREITNGLGEVFKYGIIADPDLFFLLGREVERFYACDLEFIEPILRRCCQIKSKIVGADERDQGLRKILNHGHSLGHALEAATSYTCFTHGEAVLWGILAEAILGRNLGILSAENFEIIAQGLEPVLPRLPEVNVHLTELMAALYHDKKNRSGNLAFMLPKDLGEIVEVLLRPEEAEAHLERVVIESCKRMR